MNHHIMPAGQGHQHYQQTPHAQSHPAQRPREFLPYHMPPQSPMHHYQYNQSFSPHPQQQWNPPVQSYQHQPRWQPQQYPHPNQYPQQYMPPPHSPIQYVNQQRSPMVVSSQPSYSTHSHTPNSRHPVNYFSPQQLNSPSRPDTANSASSAAHHQHPSTPQHVSHDAPEGPSRALPPVDKSQNAPEHFDQAQTAEQLEEVAKPVKEMGSTVSLQASPILRTPFYPRLPWYSEGTTPSTFPPRDRIRRKRRAADAQDIGAVTLPNRQTDSEISHRDDVASEASTLAAPSDADTPATSHAPSESETTEISTPTTPAQAPDSSPKPTAAQLSNTPRRDPRASVAVPIIPSLPRHKPAPVSVEHKASSVASTAPLAEDETAASRPGDEPTKPLVPKSWADLVRIKDVPGSLVPSAQLANGIPPSPKNTTLADALRQYVVQPGRVAFFEPRGLVNTGNMCYMNSILQVLVFCAPFYDFLDQVRSRTVHSMKSDTPLLDAMIMFMRELRVLSSASSVKALRSTLKPEQLEKYGAPITPEYIYDAIKHLPRFQSMRRGHQQDAEEFLGFVLEGLHDECLAVMQSEEIDDDQMSDASQLASDANGWLEVGPKQKAAVTRTAGQQDAPSPVTKIFGGHLRSELRVSGQKDSVTLEPYKPLQLDIGAAHIHNIIDAIKSITKSENLTGDFGGRTAKKQVFIDSLPPVLILHLKRFQYENNFTGTQKIWKKIGYPLELELPKEVFSPSKRGGLSINGGMPKYRLTAVVYHHGKSAAGGHYTVDVLRQDFQEWVRIDDTVIRRIRAEDVAEGGAEEDPKTLARALEQHKAAQDLQKQRNMYEGLDEGQVEDTAQPWNEVNGVGSADKKKLGAGTTGVATPVSTAGKRTPNARTKEGVRDNKVAYILLYERS